LGQWLKERCEREHLTLREAAAKTGLTHVTIAHIKSGHASPESIRKLAQGFGGHGKRRLALEDHLLVLAGYRTERPREKLSEPLAQVMDKVREFSEPQLEMMVSFVDFLIEIGDRMRHLRKTRRRKTTKQTYNNTKP